MSCHSFTVIVTLFLHTENGALDGTTAGSGKRNPGSLTLVLPSSLSWRQCQYHQSNTFWSPGVYVPSQQDFFSFMAVFTFLFSLGIFMYLPLSIYNFKHRYTHRMLACIDGLLFPTGMDCECARSFRMVVSQGLPENGILTADLKCWLTWVFVLHAI